MASPDVAALLPLAESIADGSSVDWDAAEAGARADERGIVQQLRILSNLARLHRTLPANPHALLPTSFVRRSSLPPAIGSWGHLELLERLGGGTFGEVYGAWDRHLEREVALKLLHPTGNGQKAESIDSPQALRVVAEGRLLARVRHPNVISVHGVAVHDGRVGLWMDLVRGGTLEQLLLKRGPFSAKEAALVGIDLCGALAAIHAAGLIHRDVKAQNVMREEGGRIVLMDLGTGREIDPGRRRTLPELAGTPLYLAPEIFTGSEASERSDLYSLGVLLYHVVTGSFPVRATTIDELQEAHLNGAEVRLRDARADLPTAFVRVIDRAIASDPSRRYQSAGALEADLADALDDKAVPAAPPARAERRVKLLAWRRAALLVATMAAIVTLAAIGRSVLGGRVAPTRVPGPIRSIAVLPLANLSGDPSLEYFADGMTDELIGTLGRLDGLSVISRTSTMQFKGLRRPLPEIARALHVDAVIEGSVLVVPDSHPQSPSGAQRVRINARLIYAGSDTQLWDRTFESVVADVFSLEGEVAKAVADGIDLHLTSQQQWSLARTKGTDGRANPTVNPQAYEAYLRGRYLWNKRTPEDLEKALAEFKKAVDFDPTSALVWSGLADAYNLLATYDDQPPRQVKPLAQAAARKALDLDDSLAEAHAALADFEWNYDWNLGVAQKEFERAFALNPSYASAHQWHGLYLNWAGRFDEGFAEMQRAQELDPLSPIIKTNIARCYLYTRRYDKAAEILDQLRQTEPDFWALHALLGQIYLAQRRYDDAIRELVQARTLSPSSTRNLGVLGDVYARAGRRADAFTLLGELSALSRGRYVPPVYPAMIYMGLGDKSKALDLLEQAYADRSDWILQMRVEPEFDSLRDEPRFRVILSRALQESNRPGS